MAFDIRLMGGDFRTTKAHQLLYLPTGPYNSNSTSCRSSVSNDKKRREILKIHCNYREDSVTCNHRKSKNHEQKGDIYECGSQNLVFGRKIVKVQYRNTQRISN